MGSKRGAQQAGGGGAEGCHVCTLKEEEAASLRAECDLLRTESASAQGRERATAEEAATLRAERDTLLAEAAAVEGRERATSEELAAFRTERDLLRTESAAVEERARVAGVGGASLRAERGRLLSNESAGLSGQEELVTLTVSMRCDTSALSGSKKAMEAVLKTVVTEFGGRECRVEWTRGPSEDTLQRVLALVLGRVEPEGAWQFYFVCRAWRQELEARGLCSKTVQLCSALAEGGRAESLRQNAQRRLDMSTADAERALCSDGGAFLEKSAGWEGSAQEWLQVASQEPDASFLSRGAASTAQSLGLPLVQWIGKPQGMHPGLHPLTGHSKEVCSVAISPDGKTVVSGSCDRRLKTWSAETGAEVSLLDCYLTESVDKVGMQKSTPPQIRQLILYHTNMKSKLADLCRNRLLQNNFLNTFCEMNWTGLVHVVRWNWTGRWVVGRPATLEGPIQLCGFLDEAHGLI